jgi:aspartyl-tRNA(Asn)/glutamyl-tRNA(Gln) amidotransferase subunit B
MAIEYEIERQIAVLESGGAIQQVTMGWNERENHTVLQRSKEHAEDYRYFPEPDLPPLLLSPEYVETVHAQLPELPDAKRERLLAEYGLKPQDAEVLVVDAEVCDYYEACVVAAAPYAVDAQTICNWVIGELFRLLNETNTPIARSPATPQALAVLLDHVKRGVVNTNTGKDVLSEMFETGREAEAIIAEKGLAQISDVDALKELVAQVIRDHPGPVSQYLAGKASILGFFIGQVMRATRGKANPQIVRELLQMHLHNQREG